MPLIKTNNNFLKFHNVYHITKIYLKKLRSSQNRKRPLRSKNLTRFKLMKRESNKFYLKLFSYYLHKTKSSFSLKSLYNLFRKKSILLNQLCNSSQSIIDSQPIFTKHNFTNAIPQNLKVFSARPKYVTTQSKKTKPSVMKFNTVFKIRLPLRKALFKAKKRNQLVYLNV